MARKKGKGFVRMTFSVPAQLADDLMVVSAHMGMSRTAVLSHFMEEPLHDLRGIMELVPQNPSDADVIRLRGASKKVIEDRLREVEEMMREGYN